MKKYIDRFNEIAIKFSSILVIAIVLVSIATFAIGHNPFEIFSIMVGWPIEDMRKIGNVIGTMAWMIPIALSFAVAFKTGLFNIGMSGQMLFAGIFGVKLAMDGTNLLIVVVVMILLGAFIGAISGALKAFFKVHEVVSTIMLNWAVFNLYRWFYRIDSPWSNSVNGNSNPLETTMESEFLNNIFPNSTYISLGIFFAILVVGVVYVLFKYTTLGLKLTSTGKSSSAAKAAGINVRFMTIMSMAIAGALAGLGGAIYYLGYARSLTILSGPPLAGFDGITVSLLGGSGAIGILVSSFLMGIISYSPGGFTGLGLDKNYIVIISALLIATIAMYPWFKKEIVPKIKSIFIKEKEEVLNKVVEPATVSPTEEKTVVEKKPVDTKPVAVKKPTTAKKTAAVKKPTAKKTSSVKKPATKTGGKK